MPTLEQQRRALSAFQRLEILKSIQAETAAELDALLPSVLARAFITYSPLPVRSSKTFSGMVRDSEVLP
jgi:hypothetical protein